MSNLPYTFTIACARAKNKFKDPRTGKTRYGAYPAGFLEFAREILVRGDREASIGHIPGVCAHEYFVGNGYQGAYGRNDFRIDIDPSVDPDILFDVRKLHELIIGNGDVSNCFVYLPEQLANTKSGFSYFMRPDAIIIDRDYSSEDAKERENPDTWPADLDELTRQCLRIVMPGAYVGVLDLRSPRLSKEKYVKVFQVPIMLPDGARQRIFTVWRNREEVMNDV